MARSTAPHAHDALLSRYRFMASRGYRFMVRSSRWRWSEDCIMSGFLAGLEVKDSSVDYRGRVDVLHVVETFQRVEQPLHARGLVALQDVLGDRLHGDLGERRL